MVGSCWLLKAFLEQSGARLAYWLVTGLSGPEGGLASSLLSQGNSVLMRLLRALGKEVSWEVH